MGQYRTFLHRNQFFVLLATTLIFLAGCKGVAASQVPYTGGQQPVEPLYQTQTLNPTVTPIKDLPTRTPRGLLIPPLPTIPEAATATPLPGFDTSQTPPPEGSSLPTGRISGRPLGLIPSRSGLWAMYPNGARLTLLTSDPILHLSVSPTGWAAAYITNPDPEIFFHEKPYGYTLNIVTLYDSRTFTVTVLDPPGLSADSPPEVLDTAFQRVRAYQNGALAWSPNGQHLAFTSLHETSPEQSASSNVYIYTLGSSNLRRLTSLDLPQGPAHPYGLSWSPFSESIYYAVAYNFGAGAGFPMAGAWVAPLNGPPIQVAAGEETGGESLLAWQTAGTFLLSSWNGDCGDQKLRKVHMQNNMRGIDVTPLWDGCYASARYNPLRDEVLISITPQQSASAVQPPGMYLVPLSGGQARALAGQGFEQVFNNTARGAGASSPAWFGYNPGEGLFSIQRNGTVQPFFTGPPFDGSEPPSIRPLFPVSDTDWLWAGDGLYVCRPGYPPQQIFDRPVSSVTGAPGVAGLYYFMAAVTNAAPAAAIAADAMQLYAVRAGDWQPYIVDERIAGPQRLEWTSP